MANISDSASIFVGATLDAFNEMERLVGRDGDVAGAQAQMQEAMKKVSYTVTVPAGSGATHTRRKQ